MDNFDYPEVLKRQWPYAVLPLDHEDLAYMNMARCACRSMRLAMCQLRRDGQPPPEELPNWSEHDRYYRHFHTKRTSGIRERLRGIPTHTFVRNPFDRLISFYLMPRKALIKGYYLEMGLGESADAISFDEFVLRFVQIPFEQLDNHALHQNLYVRDERGVFVDYIGRLENVADDWLDVQRMARMSVELSRVREGRGKPITRPSYTPETLELAYRYYESDFQVLGYSRSYANVDLDRHVDVTNVVPRGYSMPDDQARVLRDEIQRKRDAYTQRSVGARGDAV